MTDRELPLVLPLMLFLPRDTTTQSPDFGTVVQQLASEFTSDASQLLLAIDGVVIDISRLAYVTILLLGLFLYFTHLQRRLGKDLIAGGILLAVLSEFFFPLIAKT